VTPDQLTLVEETLASLDLDDLAGDFYARAFAEHPALSALFQRDPAVQRHLFGAGLAEVTSSIRNLDEALGTARALGSRHRTYGVRAVHYRQMGTALLEALAAALGPAWTTDVEDAWTLGYNLIAEMMQMGALEGPAA
jgi:nitric oxide dioxygenase